MAEVRLRAPLSELCNGNAFVLEGTTVGEVLHALEREHTAVAGWILDEHGRIREHVNIFVNGDRGGETTPVGERDRLHVLPAITGGA
jgi:molybdopterin converting factor small subunit